MTPLESTTKPLNGEQQEFHDSAATAPIANKQEHVSEHLRSVLGDSPVKGHRRRSFNSLGQSENRRSPVPVDADPTNIRHSTSRDGVAHRRRSLNSVSEHQPKVQEPLQTTTSRSNSRDGIVHSRRSLNSVSEHGRSSNSRDGSAHRRRGSLNSVSEHSRSPNSRDGSAHSRR
jgi:hypothetical protein